MNASEIIKTFCRPKSYVNLFIQKLRVGGLSDEQIVIVINAIGGTCNECWDDGADCQCGNDL